MLHTNHLLHFTMIDTMREIISSNSLRCAERGFVSLTRDQNHLYVRPEYQRDVLLVIDRDRLRSKHAIIPDAGDIKRPKTDQDRERWVRRGLIDPSKGWKESEKEAVRRHGRECEERIFTDVKMLHRYVVEIIIRDQPVRSADIPWTDILLYAERHGIQVSTAKWSYGRPWMKTKLPVTMSLLRKSGQKRSPEIERFMSGAWSAPVRHDGMLGFSTLMKLMQLREKSSKIVKAGNVVDRDARYAINMDSINEILHDLAGPNAIIDSAQFFSTPFPFPVHADTLRDTNDIPWKVLLIPLGTEPSMETGTIFFNQRWTGLSANFVRGLPNFKSVVHDTVTDYRNLLNRTTDPFPEDVRRSRLPHIPCCALHGLSVDSIIEWKVGSIIVFDCGQLHASDDFRNAGTKVIKHGLTIITKIV